MCDWSWIRLDCEVEMGRKTEETTGVGPRLNWEKGPTSGCFIGVSYCLFHDSSSSTAVDPFKIR